MRRLIPFVLLVLLATSCEKDITLDLPQGEVRLVVDGYVETGLPPYILLSRSEGYFNPIGVSSLNNLPERGARVYISNGTDTVQLLEIDTLINGIRVSGCYIALDPLSGTFSMTGIPGTTYSLHVITSQGVELRSEAKLQVPVPLDSTWFAVQGELDSLGWAFARLTDPDTLDNCYRWFARRLGKDSDFIPPFGSAFEDKFINGRSFDFAATRGSIQNSTAPDDNNAEAGYFKVGDTILVKFCTIDRGTFTFWRDAENQLSGNGSPFAVPANIKSNIQGGLGCFATYAPVFDTIIAQRP